MISETHDEAFYFIFSTVCPSFSASLCFRVFTYIPLVSLLDNSRAFKSIACNFKPNQQNNPKNLACLCFKAAVSDLPTGAWYHVRTTVCHELVHEAWFQDICLLWIHVLYNCVKATSGIADPSVVCTMLRSKTLLYLVVIAVLPSHRGR